MRACCRRSARVVTTELGAAAVVDCPSCDRAHCAGCGALMPGRARTCALCGAVVSFQ